MASRPGFTAVAILTLALGIGATTAMFGTINAALLGRLPFDGPDRLVMGRVTFDGNINPTASGYDYYDYRDQAQSFESLSAFMFPDKVTVLGGPKPERVASCYATWDLFRTLRVRPAAGRDFRVHHQPTSHTSPDRQRLVYPIDQPPQEGESQTRGWADLRIVLPGYLKTMGFPLLAGRDIAETDTEDSPRIMIISESMAKEFFPGQDPLGQKLLEDLGEIVAYEVVGFGVEPNGPATFILVASGFGLIGLMACLVPAWRATRIGPVLTLQAE